jgi:hypothetical protein
MARRPPKGGGKAGPLRVRVQIKDVDKGYRDMMKRINDAKHAVLAVGITAGTGGQAHKGGGGMTVLGIATIHEFGLGVPERSFMRAWFDTFQPQAKKMITIMLQSVVKGTRTKAQAMELLGVRFVGEIQKFIVNGVFDPLSRVTIRAKGSSKPLIDTGQLRSSITFRIELDGQASGDRTETVAVPPTPKKPPSLKKRLQKASKAAFKGAKQAAKSARRSSRILYKSGSKAARQAFKGAKRVGKKGAKLAKRGFRKFLR